MRYAFVDDATLDAAKRMEGEATVRSLLETAGDILALENLIRAVLFYDRVLYLEKDEGRKRSIRNRQVFEQFQRVCIDWETRQNLLDTANRITDDFIPCIEGGCYTDDCFCSFFQSLDIDLRFAWERRDETFCLVPKILGPKSKGAEYKRLLYMMFHELRDTSFQKEIQERLPLLYDSQGQIINQCYTVRDNEENPHPSKLSHQAEILFQALNHMAFRSFFYSMIAKELGVDLILSPIRSTFQRCCHSRNQKKEPVNQRKEVPFQEVPFQGVPLFVFWIADHMKTDVGFLRAAFELREEKEFVEARKQMNEIEMLTDENPTKDKTLAGLEQQMRFIAQKYATEQKERAEKEFFAESIVRAGNEDDWGGDWGGVLPKIEDFRYCVMPESLSINADRIFRFAFAFRSVKEDLDRIAEIEGSYDRLTLKINYCMGATLQNIPVISDEMLGKSQGWRVPM